MGRQLDIKNHSYYRCKKNIAHKSSSIWNNNHSALIISFDQYLSKGMSIFTADAPNIIVPMVVISLSATLPKDIEHIATNFINLIDN
jgi:hypothetical protein